MKIYLTSGSVRKRYFLWHLASLSCCGFCGKSGTGNIWRHRAKSLGTITQYFRGGGDQTHLDKKNLPNFQVHGLEPLLFYIIKKVFLFYSWRFGTPQDRRDFGQSRTVITEMPTAWFLLMTLQTATRYLGCRRGLMTSNCTPRQMWSLVSSERRKISRANEKWARNRRRRLPPNIPTSSTSSKHQPR